MSLPTSSALNPAATAAAPPELPPGLRSMSHGLLVRPYTGFTDCQSARPTGMLVLPRITAPAAFTFAVAGASCCDTKPCHAATPQVVGSPCTLMDSLSVIGRP